MNKTQLAYNQRITPPCRTDGNLLRITLQAVLTLCGHRLLRFYTKLLTF